MKSDFTNFFARGTISNNAIWYENIDHLPLTNAIQVEAFLIELVFSKTSSILIFFHTKTKVDIQFLKSRHDLDVISCKLSITIVLKYWKWVEKMLFFVDFLVNWENVNKYTNLSLVCWLHSFRLRSKGSNNVNQASLWVVVYLQCVQFQF